jgi:hypothetical protein
MWISKYGRRSCELHLMLMTDLLCSIMGKRILLLCLFWRKRTWTLVSLDEIQGLCIPSPSQFYVHGQQHCLHGLCGAWWQCFQLFKRRCSLLTFTSNAIGSHLQCCGVKSWWELSDKPNNTQERHEHPREACYWIACMLIFNPSNRCESQ